MVPLLLIQLHLIALHTIDGRPIHINPEAITQILEPRPKKSTDHRALHEKVRCVIRLSDGSWASVREDCDTVRRAVEDRKE